MLKRLITVAALAVATFAGTVAISSTAEAHRWHPHRRWHHAHWLRHWPSPYHHSSWEHRNWDRLHTGWRIHGRAWWDYQRPWHYRHHHRHHVRHAYMGGTSVRCWWGHEWRHGHPVTVKVCKTVYY